MKLSELLTGIGTEPSVGARQKLEVTGVASDSRQVKPGDLFVALPGTKTDGNAFVQDAVTKGAVAVLTEKDVSAGQTPVFRVPNARQALALVAGNFFQNPARELALLGITGTNGKTTTAWLLDAMCSASGANTGLLGTIGNRWAGELRDATHTTADPISLHRTFRSMVDSGVDTCVMEVSSHALDQDRVYGLSFRAAAFTNLSRDHLDYHQDLEKYFQAKRKLFTELLSPGGVGVVNGDDTYANRLYSELRGQKRMAWKFSRQGNGELSATQVELTTSGIKAVLKTPAGDIAIKSELIGAHNLDNILAATGMALSAGCSRRDVQDGVMRVRRVPGRMERVEATGRVALVDYAHTDDALRKALESARGITKGKLIVVFGCGGDRDKGKRPLMGEAAGELADLPIVTSDNPRSEDPDDIAGEIVPGLEKAGLRRMGAAKAKSGEKGYLVELDRRAAIRLAASLAKPGDTILVAGKGHEATQEQNGEKKPFDDVAEATAALEG
ncbi:MAG: UDP-N-acetylmuramoyl-L-alanyl-D-glutamate--2,6-diaminopimelate ligase [Myxococcaceae bacterium]|nr:UDP-N-acetylmuramoyl-L-alanyl-D-glutamate--2,6-diaminopimelate ligase [Myxococcaceae bacterium]